MKAGHVAGVRHRLDIMSPPVLFGGMYLLFFGLTAIDVALVQDPTIYRLRYSFLHFQELSASALSYVWFGYLVFVLGYYLPIGRAVAQVIPGRDSCISPERASIVTMVLFGATFLTLAWFVRRFGIGRRQGVEDPTVDVLFLSVVGELSFIFFALGVWRFMLSRRPGTHEMSIGDVLFVWCVMFPLQVAFSVWSGGRSTLLIVFLIILLGYHYGYRRIRMRTLGLGVLLFAVLMGPSIVFLRDDRDVKDIIEIASPAFVWGSVMARNSSLEGFTVTFEDLENAPEPEDSLWLLLGSVIPRVLWSDKPVSLWMQEFSAWSGGSSEASFLPSLPGEFLLRFGYVGGLIAIMLLGVFWRVAFSVFIGFGERPFAWGFVYLILLSQGLSTVESGFVIPYGALLRLVVVGLATFFLVRTRRARPTRVTARLPERAVGAWLDRCL